MAVEIDQQNKSDMSYHKTGATIRMAIITDRGIG